MFRRIKHWIRDKNIPYTERSIEYLVKKRKELNRMSWLFLVIDVIFFATIFYSSYVFTKIALIFATHEGTISFDYIPFLLTLLVFILTLITIFIMNFIITISIMKDVDQIDLIIMLKRERPYYE